MVLKMSDTKQARQLIASQASELCKQMTAQFQALDRALLDGSVHHFTQKENRTGYGLAKFLYETISYDDDRTEFSMDIEKLKSLLNAVMALEKVEQDQ